MHASAQKSLYHKLGPLCFCQRNTKTALECPARSSKPPIGIGYVSLANQLLQFDSHGQLPFEIDIERLDDGEGIEATLMKHCACWHKTCRLKFNQTKLDRLNKKEKHETISTRSQGVQTRSSTDVIDAKKEICFFCGEPPESDEAFHHVSTYDLDREVRQCALELEDTALLAKLAPGDLIALEAKYHHKCLAALYNRARSARSHAVEDSNANLHGIAFAELVAYIEDFRSESSIAPVFKLADLAEMYKARLEQLGAAIDGRIHTSRLRLRLLSVFPDLTAHLRGRSMMLSFSNDIGDALKKACDHDSDHDALHLARAAKVVRKEMFNHKFSFNGSFTEESQQNFVPQCLLALVSMILEGPNIKGQLVNATNSVASNTISQLLMFNSVKHRRSTDSCNASHQYEVPLSLYIAMKLHAVTRKRSLIDTLFKLGICVSYDRLLKLTSDVSTGVCEQFVNNGVVCPSKLRSGIFTSAAVDNIDYNPSAATAKDSFHGTGISLIQHPSYAAEGGDRGVVVINDTSLSRSILFHHCHHSTLVFHLPLSHPKNSLYQVQVHAL